MRTNHQGVALIQVLFMTAIMSIIAIQFVKTARNQVSIAQGFNDRLQAELHLKTAKSRLLFTLFKYDANNLSDQVINGAKWNLRGTPFQLYEDVNVSVSSATAFLSLVSAPDEYLIKVFLSVGVEESQARKIVNSIKDWIDSDDVITANGAENGFYKSLGMLTRNGTMQHISELKVIRGMTPEIYQAVKSLFTIYTTISINPMLTSERLDRAIFSENIAKQLATAKKTQNFTENTWKGIVGSRQFQFIDLYPGSVFIVEMSARFNDVVVTERFDVKVKSQKGM